MQDVLASAIELHQNGQSEPAAELYEALVRREPQNADAWHLLGVLRHQQGDHKTAAELIRRAIALRPGIPVFHANLAEVYRAAGQFDRALGSCRIALRLWPDFPEALGNLGLVLQGLGRHEEAIAQFQRALTLSPDLAATHNNLGISLRQIGRREQALVHFQRAVTIDPGSASSRTNLGLLLLSLDRAEEALPHCQEAVRLQPDLAALRNNLGNVLRASGRLMEARVAYTEALTLDPDLAAAHANLGQVLQSEGELAQALLWLRQAVALRPDDANLQEQLGDLLMDLESAAEAIPCYERVLILKPDRAVTHNSLGWALQEEGRLTEAEEHYRTAERLRPGMPATQSNLGGLHEERGDFVAAEGCFRAALQLNPAYAQPRSRLATLLRGKLSEADRSELERSLSAWNDSEEARPALLFGLAQVHDARGEYARAAECLREANRLALQQASKRGRGYDPGQHTQFVDGLLRVFDRDFFQRTARFGLATRRPVFIVGLPRSGTTLIEQILASHSRVHGAGELLLVRRSFESIPAQTDRREPPLAGLPEIDAAGVRRLAEQHLQWLAGFDRGTADCIVDKMPDNYLYAGWIATMFPEAVLIHCRRDLRDVAVSCWMTHFRSIRWANDASHIAARFADYGRVMEHWRHVLPTSIHEVDYEETVENLEAVARRLVAVCGLDWEPACLEFHRTDRVVRTASVTQVRQPIYKRSVARWKHYETALADLFAKLPAARKPTAAEQSPLDHVLSSIPPNPVQEFA